MPIASSNSYSFYGCHVLGEISEIPDTVVRDGKRLETALVAAVKAGGATICQTKTEYFRPHGSTTILVLAESHASIHAYPEHNALFYDVFTCGSIIDPMLIGNLFNSYIHGGSHSFEVKRRGFY